MRLLKFGSNGEPYLKSFTEVDAPPYAVLSHTWQPKVQEVTFKDIVENSGRTKIGYHKVEFCGSQAQRDGLEYFWIDSCCIDKSSSAELANAINSMFRWYRNAKKCYVYLTDVSIISGTDRDSWESAFRRSRWFTRGWTLQELLAPGTVEFFSSEGHKLGDRKALERLVHEVTGIAFGALQGNPLSHFSNEEIFLWADKRQTMEPEDKAYSILGMFDVFMPLIYGEGEEHALGRLREAIAEGVNRTTRNTEQGEATNSASQREKPPERTNAVRMATPNDPTADCIIEIHIGGPTVPDIIFQMTNVEVKIISGKRQVVLANGTRVIPTQVMQLDGFSDAGIDRIFPPGDDIAVALKTSNLYKKEKKGESSVLQSCVSFLIPADQNDDVILRLTLGREMGNKIAEKLFA